jgi:hypothetical protein
MSSSQVQGDVRLRELVQQASKVVLTAYTDPKEDARAERAKATFSSDELAAYINDGEDKLRRRYVCNL